jgi:hypothetical protein
MNKTSLIFAALCAASFAVPQSVTLRLNLQAGKTYRYAASNRIVSTGLAAMDMSQSMTMAISILSKTGQGSRTRTKISNIKVSTKAQGPAAEQVKNSAAKLEGASFEATYNSRGQIVPGSVKATAEGNAAAQLGAMGLGFMGMQYPAGPVSAGSKWSGSADFGKLLQGALGGAVQAKKGTLPISFRLVRFEKAAGKTFAHVNYAIKGVLDLAVRAGQQGQSMNMKVAVDMTGSAVVDTSNGIPTKGTAKGTTSMTLGQGMNVSQKTSATFLLKQ